MPAPAPSRAYLTEIAPIGVLKLDERIRHLLTGAWFVTRYLPQLMHYAQLDDTEDKRLLQAFQRGDDGDDGSRGSWGQRFHNYLRAHGGEEWLVRGALFNLGARLLVGERPAKGNPLSDMLGTIRAMTMVDALSTVMRGFLQTIISAHYYLRYPDLPYDVESYLKWSVSTPTSSDPHALSELIGTRILGQDAGPIIKITGYRAVGADTDVIEETDSE